MVGTKIIRGEPEAYQFQLLVKNILNAGLRYEPDREIVYRDILRYDYRELYRRVCRLANLLTGLGVGAGDTVAVLDWDSHRYLEAYFAIPMIGAVLHTVNVRLSSAQLFYTMRHAEDKVVLVNSEFVPLFEDASVQLPSVREFVLLSDGGARPKSRLRFAGEYEELLAASKPEYEFPDFDENSVATVFYTTGTTGEPKGVYFSHRQLVLHTLSITGSVGAYQTQGRFRSDDVYMPLTPMFHVHAWGLPYMATLLGVKQVYPGKYEPEMLLKLLQSERVTLSHCVPTILHMLVSAAAAKSLDLSRWKVIIGGSALPRGLAEAALKLGIDVYSGYGMSETCPVLTITYLSQEMLRKDRASQVEYRVKTGIPIPFVDLKIVDEQGKDVAHDGNSLGEIVVRAPWLTNGYLKDEETSRLLWRGGWLHTGDMASIDEKGYVQITDRLKDMIKTGGEWVSSLEVESILTQHEAVSEAAVVGLPNDKWGERPYALVVLKQGSAQKAAENDIIDFLKSFVERGLLNSWSVPDRVVFAESIPKTSVGKIDKKKIRQDLAAGSHTRS
ncbi:MAG TPA: fatty acid--CoA ligase [Candidatus Kryptobacter bacterium]|nr:MAG: long-chain fatty acid--CoA ligase [Ignavibacteriae bacterium 37-53-5]HQT91015.1 fatty acid--CoA ligase [Candidatus Kryptobacter bacterium]